MRPFTAILATATLFTVGSLAAPEAGGYGGWGHVKRPSYGQPPACMSDSDAQTVANNFQQSIANYSDAAAEADFTSNFHDYSDSVNELINNGCPSGPAPLGSATFSSRAAFMQGQGSQPPIPFQQLNVWHNCNTVTLRWRSQGPGQEPEEVTGIIVLETVYQNKKWLIQTVYSEFNSGAWLYNLGIFKPTNCSSS